MMRRMFSVMASIFLLSLCSVVAATAQSRIALIIGNSAYRSTTPLATTIADASIVAETMRAAGYDVTELHDVRQADVGLAMRDFLDKVAAAGPDAVAFVYYAGQAAQSGGENYLVPVDAAIVGAAEVPLQSLRLVDLLNELANLPAAARIIVLDASRDHGYGRGTAQPVPPGLAIMETPPGMMIAFAAAPGTIVVPGDAGPHSLYTSTLVTLMRQGGLDLDQIFKATRLQVNRATGGKQTPWTAAGLLVDVTLFPAPPQAVPPPAPGAPPIPPKGQRAVSKGMLSGLSPDDAYTVVIEEDSLAVYQWFVEIFPKHQYAAQFWDIINTRRDELLWRRALAKDTRNSYWNYLDRYPNGVHAGEAQERLERLSVPRLPPPTYTPVFEPLPPDYYDEAMDIPRSCRKDSYCRPWCSGYFRRSSCCRRRR